MLLVRHRDRHAAWIIAPGRNRRWYRTPRSRPRCTPSDGSVHLERRLMRTCNAVGPRFLESSPSRSRTVLHGGAAPPSCGRCSRSGAGHRGLGLLLVSTGSSMRSPSASRRVRPGVRGWGSRVGSGAFLRAAGSAYEGGPPRASGQRITGPDERKHGEPRHDIRDPRTTPDQADAADGRSKGTRMFRPSRTDRARGLGLLARITGDPQRPRICSRNLYVLAPRRLGSATHRGVTVPIERTWRAIATARGGPPTCQSASRTSSRMPPCRADRRTDLDCDSAGSAGERPLLWMATARQPHMNRRHARPQNGR